MTGTLATLAFGLGDLLLPAGLALIALAVWQFVRQRRAPGPTITPHEELERGRQVKGIEADLRKLNDQIEATTRRCGEELDEKIARLETLLEQADERIADLHAATNPAARRLPIPPDDDAGDGDEDETSTPSLAGIQTVPDPLARSVYDLADRGMNPVQIARNLREHVGKVELILALRQA